MLEASKVGTPLYAGHFRFVPMKFNCRHQPFSEWVEATGYRLCKHCGCMLNTVFTQISNLSSTCT